MGKSLIILDADFSANAIAVAKAVNGTTSPQYVYVANVVNPGSGFDWNLHKVAINVNSDGSITNFNLDDDTVAIPNFCTGGGTSSNWLQEIDTTYLSNCPLISFNAMLYRCTALKKATIGGKFLNLTGTKAVAYMFRECTALEDVVIDDSFKAPNLDDCTSMFYKSGVKSVSGLNNLIKSSVSNLESLFQYCANLQEVDFSNCNTSNVTNLENLFSECSSLTHVEGLNGLNVANVTNFKHTFYNTRIRNLDISNWNIHSNALTKEMFYVSHVYELNANCFTALYGDISNMFYMNKWNTIHLDNLNDISAVTDSNSLFSNYVSGTPKVTIANVTNEAVKTLLKSKLNAVSAGGSSNWQEATVDGVLCLVPNV